MRFIPYTGPATTRRFVAHVEDYVNSVAKEAELREGNIVLDLAAYDPLRRENSAVRSAFGLFGYVLGLELPDEIFHHPVFSEMHFAAVDMVTWSNVGIIWSCAPQYVAYVCHRICILTTWNSPWAISLTTC